jgi:signal transduction histidine kinase
VGAYSGACPPENLMRLSQFVAANLEEILAEWEIFARRMIPAAETMTALAIRDHARDILVEIVADMESAQTETQRHLKSEGLGPSTARQSGADKHGTLRQLVGFDLNQLGAEYRALRATVLRLWAAQTRTAGHEELEEVTRFNEGIDQALAESIASYSEHVATSRDTFLAMLGHDLRTPLGALAGSLEMVANPDLTPAQKAQAVQIGKRSVSSISQMITDLLEYTRSRLGRGIHVEPRRGDLGDLCRHALDELRAAYPTRAFGGETIGDLAASFDAGRMRQVLVNLLVNAVQHGDLREPVTLDARAHGDRVRLVVRNQGRPIPPESMQVIFNPLVQIIESKGDADQRPSSSLGLGLYIAREIVNGHGGTITVTSDAAHGTAITVELPRG